MIEFYEDSFLDPQLIINHSENAIQILIANNERLQDSRITIIRFINDTTISTRGINLLKEKLEDLLLIVNVLIDANLSDVADYQKLIALVEGESIIDGYTITQSIQQAEDNIMFFEDRIERLQFLMDFDGSLPYQSEHVAENVRKMINIYNENIESQHQTIDYLRGRIERYNEIEFQSYDLHSEGDGLRSEAIEGFEIILQAAGGFPISFTTPNLSIWRVEVQANRERVDVRHNDVEAVLNKIHEKGIPFPSDWSDTQKRSFARRHLDELGLIDAFISSNFTTTDFGEDASEAQKAQTALLFLSDLDLSFHLTLEHRKALLNVINENGMWARPIREYIESIEDFDIPNTPWFEDFIMRTCLTYSAATSGTSYHDWFTFLAAFAAIDGTARMTSFAGFAHDTQPGVTSTPPPGVPKVHAPVNEGTTWMLGKLAKGNKNINPQSPPTNTQNLDFRNVQKLFNDRGELMLSYKDLKKFKSEMASFEVKVVIDKKGKILGKYKENVGAFDFETGTVYLKAPTKHNAIHEGIHAKQWKLLGKEKYKALGEPAREEHVFEQIMKSDLNNAEKYQAQRYIEYIRSGKIKWPDPDWKGYE